MTRTACPLRADRRFANLAACVLALALAAAAQTAPGQNCHCTVWLVRSDSVLPCTRIIGSVTTVRTASEFRDAVNQANARGGNCTILLANGSYRVASTESFPYITAANVVIRSLSGKRDSVILEGGGMRDVAPATEDGLLIAGDSVTIADLTIRNVGNHGIQVSGHHLLVHNVRFLDTYQQMLKGATSADRIDSGIVQCCLFAFTGGMAANYYTGGIDVHKGRGWIVRDNVFTGIQSPGGSVAEHAVHFWNGSADNVVERNLILNCDRGIGFGLGASPNSGGMIRNNMIVGRGRGAFADAGIALETSPGTRVYNNTVLVTYMHAIEYRFAATTGVEIVNNLTNKPIASRDNATGMLVSNVTTAADSWFHDATNADLHLGLARNVVDIGFNAGSLVADDIDQMSRPQGGGYEIGADELYPSLPVEDPPRVPGIEFYPNPGEGLFTVRTMSPAAAITVYDALGREVCAMRPGISHAQIDLRGHAAGVYLLVVCDGDAAVAAHILRTF